MTLMTNRCVSVQGARDGGLYSSSSAVVPYGPQAPEYFFVEQQKPSPMPPLKAWRGYHGNVYFEPMHISKMNCKNSGETGQSETPVYRKPPASVFSRKSAAKRRTATPSQSRALVPVDKGEENLSMAGGEVLPAVRSATRNTCRSSTSRKSVSTVQEVSQRHVLYLDRQAVAKPDNTQMQEELQVIEKQESTGSLAVQLRQQESRRTQRPGPASAVHGDKKGQSSRRQAKSAKYDRICKGSVVHQLRRAKSGVSSSSERAESAKSSTRAIRENGSETSSTDMMVVGDRFAPPTVLSPLLRTQTQFSLSSQRMTMNSPDLYGAFERLPPLEQVRMSLRHMDACNDNTYPPRTASPYSAGGSIGVIEDLKPFIKYSPEVKAQYNRQMKYF